MTRIISSSLCSHTLSCYSPDIKLEFMEKFSETLSPTNSAALRQLRVDMAAESRKVIALTDLHDRLKQKYEALSVRNGRSMAERSEMKAKLVQEKFVKLMTSHGRVSVSRAFLRLKSNALSQRSELETRSFRGAALMASALHTWRVRTKLRFFVKWLRYCIADNVRDKLCSYERMR